MISRSNWHPRIARVKQQDEFVGEEAQGFQKLGGVEWDHAPAVMDILRRTNPNIVRTIQQNVSPDVSIGLLHDRIGRHPWILAAVLL